MKGLLILWSGLLLGAPAAPQDDPAPTETGAASDGGTAPAETEVPAAAETPAPAEAAATSEEPAPATMGEPSTVDVTNEPPPPRETVTYQIAQPQEGEPPYYSEEDMAQLRERHGLDPQLAPAERQARWRCLIADQSCGMTFEVQATSAFALRLRQGDRTVTSDILRWNSGRAQYDAQLNIPVSTETVGTFKYTRLTLGPKGGVIASDSRDVWGNMGVAGRYFFNRKAWSPTLEFSAAMTFKLLGEGRCGDADNPVDCTVPERSPIGIQADFGVGLGGWGSLIVGAQYDSPLAREDLSEEFHVASSGMVYFGFRGNILWGAPLVGAVATHTLAQRSAGPGN
jgi:hypothetical protein